MSFFQKIRSHRLLIWCFSALALIAVIAILSPQQLPVTLYKLSLVSLSAVIGYHLDRALFPYASPGSYLMNDWKTAPKYPDGDIPKYPVVKGYELVFAAVLLRRAFVVTAVILGITLGL